MLYACHSVQYWVNLVLWQGVLRGGFFRGREWLGRSTEWMAAKSQTAFNPVTKAYSGRNIRHLFGMFTEVAVRKNSFRWTMLPGLGRMVELLASGRKFPSGRLVYGAPYRAETPLELWLGRYVGSA